MVDPQEVLARQLRGLEVTSDHGVKCQASYVSEWAEELLASLCPLTVAFLNKQNLLHQRIEGFFLSNKRNRNLHLFAADFLDWLSADSDQGLATLVRWEVNVSDPSQLRPSFTTSELHAMQRALSQIGIPLVLSQ